MFKGLVKVFACHAKPLFNQPWAMRPPQKSTSSGFLIAGRLIITNAHSVAYQTLVQVRKHGCAEKVTARVVAVANDCDIAVLTVDDPSFWKDTTTLEFEALPQLHDEVIVVGYPVGGEQLSVTSGVVSRIDFGVYSFSTREHLVLQTDSAINAGNSGGPCFRWVGRGWKGGGGGYHCCSSSISPGVLSPSSRLVPSFNPHPALSTSSPFTPPPPPSLPRPAASARARCAAWRSSRWTAPRTWATSSPRRLCSTVRCVR